jgi:hypothetical protein
VGCSALQLLTSSEGCRSNRVDVDLEYQGFGRCLRPACSEVHASQASMSSRNESSNYLGLFRAKLSSVLRERLQYRFQFIIYFG